MRIVVCGMGKVERAIRDTLRPHHDVHGYDIDQKKSEISIDYLTYADAVIYIVPTPSLNDGSFDNASLHVAMHAFKDKEVGLHIVSSTATPGSCEQFHKFVYPVCYKPEFIRLDHVFDDLQAPSFNLIGASSWEAAQRCASIYAWNKAPMKIMSLTEAELAKITLNCALTMKISLANQLHLVAEKLGCDSRVIMDAVGTDPRIGKAYLRPGAPYEGPCLPRDNRMFRFVAESVGVDAALSKAADVINEAMK